MQTFKSIQEINTWESGLLAQLDTQTKMFTETIGKLLKDRNPFGRSGSNLAALNMVKQDPKRIHEGIQAIKEKHPEAVEMYTMLETMIAPEVLDINIERTRNAVFDTQGVNDYLPIVNKIVSDYIGEIKKIVQTVANIEKNNLNNQIDYLERKKLNEKLFDTLNTNYKKIQDYYFGLTTPISTILGGMFLEQNTNSPVLKEKGLLSLLNTLKGYQQKEIQMIKEKMNMQ